MTTAENRYLDAFNQFSQGSTVSKERAREFATDKISKIFDDHLLSRDKAEALMNAGTAVAAVPGSLIALKKASTKLASKIQSINDARSANAIPKDDIPEVTERQPDVRLPRPRASTRIQTDDPIGDSEFGPPSRTAQSLGGDAVNFDSMDYDAGTGVFSGGEQAQSGVSSAGQSGSLAESEASNARSLVSNTAKTAVKTAARMGSKATEAISNVARQGVKAAGDVGRGASTAARAVIGDAAVDGIDAVAGSISEVAAPISALLLLGTGIFDLVEALKKPKLDTNVKVPINKAKTAVVAPSIDAALTKVGGSVGSF